MRASLLRDSQRKDESPRDCKSLEEVLTYMFRAPSEGLRPSMTTACSTATSDGPFVRTRSVSQKLFPALYQGKRKAVQSHGSFGVTRAGFTSLYSSSLSLNKDFTRLTGLKQGATALETMQYVVSAVLLKSCSHTDGKVSAEAPQDFCGTP